MAVNLEKLLEAMESEPEMSTSYYDTVTEKLVYVQNDPLAGEENERLARQIEDNEKCFLRIPTKYEIHEYSIIKAFVNELPSGAAQQELLDAIRGKGAFRRFKQGVRYHGIEQQWYAYRAKAFREIAVSWCREHDIQYKEQYKEGSAS